MEQCEQMASGSFPVRPVIAANSLLIAAKLGWLELGLAEQSCLKLDADYRFVQILSALP